MWPPIDTISEAEYLVHEPEAEYKSEFRDGRVVAMSGASRAHVVVVSNLIVELRKTLPAECTVLPTEMRVKVEAARFYTYPDIAIVCGEEQYADAKQTTLLNPSAIIEVLSPSTEAYDRGEKFAYYKKLASLSEYVLVGQERMRVEHHLRRPDGTWPVTVLEAAEAVLELLAGARIPLREIYRKAL